MQVVGDRYRLDSELGTGGTATVWLAHDLVLDRSCAVKLLLVTQGGGASRPERMRAEAKALAALDHPHVVRVWDQGEHDGRDYIAMEYVEGGSLADRLLRGGPLAPAHAVRLMLQVLDALATAHEAGIVHRDVKPGNVLLRTEEEAALCDFGIARNERFEAGTRTGVALGSVGFMAPEQRIDARRVGPPADLYAAACTLFNLLTGDTPVDLYLAPDHSPRWESVPAPLRSVLRRATQANPDDRYFSAQEMSEALAQVQGALDGLKSARRRLADTPIGAHPPTQVPNPSLLSLKAQERSREVQPVDWGWAEDRRPVGRAALWTGVILVVVISLMALLAGPFLDDFEARVVQDLGVPDPAPEIAVAEPAVHVPAPVVPRLAGRWVGVLSDTHEVSLVLEGMPEALEGDIVIALGVNEARASVSGAWDPESARLVLREPGNGATYTLGMVSEHRTALEGARVQGTQGPPQALVLVWRGPAQ